MKYLRTYELFGFGKKSPKSWKEKFQDIYNFYKENINTREISILDLPRADIKDDSLSISMRGEFLVFYNDNNKGRHKLEVLDFSDVDINNPESNKGVYKITKEEYEEYEEKIKEISDWLDIIDEHNFNKSNTSISDDGELEMGFDGEDLALEEISDKIKSEINIIGKEFKFEASYHLWTSPSTNDLVVERIKLKINDLKIGFNGSFYCQLFTLDPFGEEANIWLTEKSSPTYYDFEKNKWPYSDNKDQIIRMHSSGKERTRKEKRDFEKNRKFPYSFQFDLTPCEWNTMELIKNITSLLEQMNSETNISRK